MSYKQSIKNMKIKPLY